MPTNIIYNVITHLVNTKLPVALPAGVKIVPPKDTNKYFLFQLTVSKKSVVCGDYTLTDHHLTVNEEVLTRSGMKSQYHYTAMLVDKSNTKFRLHIYYDTLGGHSSRLFLDKVVGNDSYQPVECDEFHPAFSAFAQNSIKDLTAYLKKAKESLEKEHLLKYMGLERAATELSKNLDANKAAYLTKVDDLIKALNELALYSTKQAFILSNLSFFNRIRRVLATPLAQESQVTFSASSKDMDSKSKDDKVDQLVKKPGPSNAAVVQPAPKKVDLSSVIAKLQKDLDGLKMLNGEVLVNALVALFNAISDVEFEIDDEIYSATVNDIQALRLLKKEVENNGLNLLIKELSAGKYEIANKLGQFHHFLAAPNYLSDFIAKNNPGLIEFLIVNNILPVDYGHFVINNVAYDSLVAYFFKMAADAPVNSAAAAPMVVASAAVASCLSVLIKNGASLMGVDGATGLPFAASLMLDNKHPLQSALRGNEELTMNNGLFCKQLNHLLRSLIVHPDCTPDTKAKINQLLLQTEVQITTSQLVKANPLLGKVQKGVEDYKHRFEAVFKGPVLERLFADPEYLALKQSVHQRLITHLAKLPRVERMRLSGWKETQQKVDAMLVEKSTVNMTYETFKEVAMEAYNKVLADMDTRERLLVMQQDMKRPRAGRKSLNKARKEVGIVRSELAALAYAEEAPAREMAQINKELEVSKNLLNALGQLTSKYKNLQTLLGGLKSESLEKQSSAHKRNTFFSGASNAAASSGANTAAAGFDVSPTGGK